MEDNTKSKDQAGSASAEAHKIVELTPDMEIATDAGGRVIELTEALDAAVRPAAEPQSDEPPQTPAQTPGEPASAEAESRSSDIEKEIDLAFESVQSIETDTPAGADGDKVDQLTQMADTVLDEETEPVSEKEISTPGEPAQADTGFLEESGMAFELAPETEASLPAEDLRTDAKTGAEQEDKDEDVIDLVSVVEPPAPEAAEDDDDIIELTTVVSKETAETATPEDDDDEIIELVNIVHPVATEPAEPGIAAREVPETDLEGDDPAGYNEQIIKLSDVLDEAKKRKLTREDGNGSGLDEAIEADAQPRKDDDVFGNLGIELDSALENSDKDVATMPEDQIEAAVERLLYTKYAPQIEKAIAQAVKRAVAKEVEGIKRSMLKQKGNYEQD